MPEKNKAADQFPLQQWPIPQVGTSPITGVTGSFFWGGINRPDKASRWVIGDSDLNDAPNMFPQQVQLQQLPNVGASVATLAATAIWMNAQVLNANLFNYFLCTDGHVYQVSTSGTIVDVLAAGTFTESGTLNSTINVTGLSSTTNMFVGMLVSGGGISPGTTIATIVSSSAITLSVAASFTGTEILTFSLPAFGVVADISNWQGTIILLSDLTSGNTYAWNGVTTVIALHNQPAAYITVYGDRVWLFDGTNIVWTQGGTYNSLAGDSGAAQITDSSCASPIQGAISGLGVIVVFGASWIATISNLNDTGAPAVLTFQFTTLSGQVGIGNKFSIIACGNSFYFANGYGIWDLQGSAPVKVSVQLDGFFGANLDLTRSSFNAAYVSLFQQPCLLWQIYYNGDTNVASGYTLVGCTLANNAPSQWFRVSQGTITHISSLPASTVSAQPSPFGTDGTHVFPLFTDTTTVYNAQIYTKIWDFYSKISLKTFDYCFFSVLLTGGGSTATFTLSVVNETGTPVLTLPPVSASTTSGFWINKFGVQGPWINTALVTGTWVGSLGMAYFPLQFGLTGHMRGLGLNLTINSSGCVVQALVIGYRGTTGSRGPGQGIAS